MIPHDVTLSLIPKIYAAQSFYCSLRFPCLFSLRWAHHSHVLCTGMSVFFFLFPVCLTSSSYSHTSDFPVIFAFFSLILQQALKQEKQKQTTCIVCVMQRGMHSGAFFISRIAKETKQHFSSLIIGNPLFDLLSIPDRAGFPCRWIFSSLFFFCSSLYDNWSNWSRRDTKKEKWNGRNGWVLSDRAVKGSREMREICQTYAWCMGGWLLVRFDFWGKDSPDLDKGLHLT